MTEDTAIAGPKRKILSEGISREKCGWQNLVFLAQAFETCENGNLNERSGLIDGVIPFDGEQMYREARSPQVHSSKASDRLYDLKSMSRGGNR